MLASWHLWGERFLNSLLLGLYTCTMIIDISLYFSRYFTVEKFPLIKDSICLISFKCFSNMTRCFFIIYVIFFIFLNLLITLSTPYGIFLLVLTYMQWFFFKNSSSKLAIWLINVFLISSYVGDNNIFYILGIFFPMHIFVVL